MGADLVPLMKRVLRDPVEFAYYAGGLTLRSYQEAVARAVVESVLQGQGLSFVVMFPRQSGKNELQAQIETYLLTLLQQRQAEIIKVSPTWKPQSLNAMRRLQRSLERNLLARAGWVKEQGYIYRIGGARIFFLSGAPEANIVGATASTLLEVDEAQDVLVDKFDKDIAPMAASTNATRVFWGTAWTGQTLLARELRAAREAEDCDGRRRVFVIGADEVAAEVPAYGQFVAEQVARLGRTHPMVRSQFFSEEVDAQGGMFPPARRQLMLGGHSRQNGPTPGRTYCLLLDVAGEDEGLTGPTGAAVNSNRGAVNSNRDSTALTVVEVDLSTLSYPALQAPTYRVIDRRQWLGVGHTTLYAQIKALAELWRARYVVVDATGVGAGLASFLERALPGRVLPFLFNAASKSRLGWGFLAMVETGRYREYAPAPDSVDSDQAQFWGQIAACQMTILPGPEQRLRWSVPDGARDPHTGERLHDDWVLSAALACVLDGQTWSVGGPTTVVLIGPDGRKYILPRHELDRQTPQPVIGVKPRRVKPGAPQR